MEVISDFFTVIIGRYVLGGIGYFFRLMYLKILNINKKRTEFDDIINIDDFKNRIVGFVVVLIVIILVLVFIE